MLKNILLTLLLAAFVAPATLLSQISAPSDRTSEIARTVPPVFIENRGQWPAAAAMLARGHGYDLWVTKGGFVYDLFRMQGIAENASSSDGGTIRRTGAVVRMNFVSASNDARARGLERLDGYHNYLIGDRSRWAVGVPLYQEARIENLYAGVDAMLTFENGSMRYDLLVGAGVDPSAIAIRYEGALDISVDAGGDLLLRTSIGELRQRKPYAYQKSGDAHQQVACRFVERADGSVAFDLGSYDRSRPLVIDPLVYSTVISVGVHDSAYDMKVDRAKNINLCGWTFSPRFPVESGAYDVIFNRDSAFSDAFVAKINSASGMVIFSTFIGGAMGEMASALELDSEGRIYIAGSTGSIDFPTTDEGYDRSYNGERDIFLARLSGDGKDLLYGTYIGGASNDDGYALAIDSVGDMYVGGLTYSSNYPHTSGAYDSTYSGEDHADAVLTKVTASNGTRLVYSTFIGGGQGDQVNDIAVDRSGMAYICGGTWSSNFPVTSNAFRKVNHTASGGYERDGFAGRFSATGELVYATYVGGSRNDVANAVIVDSLNRMIICGETRSMNFPVTKNYDTFDVRMKNPDLFVMRLNPGVSLPDLSVTYGGAGEDAAYDVAMNAVGTLAICGISNSTDFTVTPGAYKTAHPDTGNFDAFFMLLDSTSFVPTYSSYIGGGRNEFAHAIAVDRDRDIYIAGATASIDYPTTTGPYVLGEGGATSVMVSRFSFKGASVAGESRARALDGVAMTPNPTRGGVRIAIVDAAGRSLRDGSRVTLFNALGDAVREVTGTVDRDGAWVAETDLSDLPAGSYWGRVVETGGSFGPIMLQR